MRNRNVSSPTMTPVSGGSKQLAAEDEQETIPSDTLKNPQLEFVHEIAQVSPLDHVGVKTDHPSQKKAVGEGKEEHELVEDVGEDDDGFRTPTSLDHKIPAIMQCPPAPVKPKPKRKRKLSLSPSSSSIFSGDSSRELIDLNFSEEVELLFRPICHDEIKKARRDGNNS